MSDVELVEHVRIVEHRERRRKLNWERHVFIDVWQFRCSCGWKTGWVENRERGELRANAHAWDGQFSFPWVI